MSSWSLRRAIKSLYQGGVIAYPTEAVYGLGCDPWNEAAALRLLDIKQRPWQKGLILIASDFNQLQDFIAPLEPEILKKITATWPGPHTWLVPSAPDIPYYLCGEYDTIAVRVSAHRKVRELCQAFGGALVSTSANLANHRPARNLREVRWHLPGVDFVLPGHCAGADKPTQITHAMTGESIR